MKLVSFTMIAWVATRAQCSGFTSRPGGSLLANKISTSKPLLNSIEAEASTLISTKDLAGHLPPLLQANANVLLSPTNIHFTSTESKRTIQHHQVPSWSIITRRLNTKQDPFNLHKISGIVNVISGLTVLGSGLVNDWTHVPSWMEIPQMAFEYSTIGICLSAARMAHKHRKNEPLIRDGMFASCSSAINIVLGATWVSPFASDWMNSQQGQIIMIVLSSLLVALCIKLLTEPTLVDFCTDRTSGKLELWQPIVARGSLIVPLVASIYYAWFNAAMIPETYAEFMNQYCTIGGSEGLANSFYWLDAGTMAILYGIFAVTLRDRKIVAPIVETASALGGIALFIPMLWISVSTHILPYPASLGDLLAVHKM